MIDNHTVPERPGTTPNGSNSSPFPNKEWLTINEAVLVFRSQQLPRTPEAIRKYCRQEKLNSQMIEGPKGEQHLVEQASIKPFVDDQLRAMQATGKPAPGHAGTSRNIPVQSVTSRIVPEQPGTVGGDEGQGELRKKVTEYEERIKKLERENRDLEIDKEVRARMNEQLEKHNEKLFNQMTQERREAQELSRCFGQLEERVQHLQISAPEIDAEVIQSSHEQERR